MPTANDSHLATTPRHKIRTIPLRAPITCYRYMQEGHKNPQCRNLPANDLRHLSFSNPGPGRKLDRVFRQTHVCLSLREISPYAAHTIKPANLTTVLKYKSNTKCNDPLHPFVCQLCKQSLSVVLSIRRQKSHLRVYPFTGPFYQNEYNNIYTSHPLSFTEIEIGIQNLIIVQFSYIQNHKAKGYLNFISLVD